MNEAIIIDTEIDTPHHFKPARSGADMAPQAGPVWMGIRMGAAGFGRFGGNVPHATALDPQFQAGIARVCPAFDKGRKSRIIARAARRMSLRLTVRRSPS